MSTTKDVEEHPIIFNDWSINHILAGEKTQTRRIVQPQPPDDINEPFWDDESQEWQANHDTRQNGRPMTLPRWTAESPYGQPGAWLWVREAFRFDAAFDDASPTELVRDLPRDRRLRRESVQYEATPEDGPFTEETQGRKRPSIHMPRELCRIRLRVEDVRVEQVQGITPEDAEAEGVDPKNALAPCGVMGMKNPYCARFAQVWNDIHGDGAWERNDWVWVIEFSRLEP